MSKIYGLVAINPVICLKEALNASYEALCQEGYVIREKWQKDKVALGHLSVGAVNTESQPVFDASKKHAAVFCGKLFDKSHHRDLLSKSGVQFKYPDNDAEHILNIDIRAGSKDLRTINGIFSLAVWNNQDERLTLVNDRYGLRSLYYYHDASRGVFVFSSELKGVVDSGLVEKKVNWQACSNFLYLGQHLGNSTSFSGVHLMPPASVLTFEDNQVRIEPYWDLNSIKIDEKIDYPMALEECNRLFSQAIRRQNVSAACDKAVLLSGGLDSRRIAAELNKQGSNFETFTVGWDADSADPMVARQVADALGIKNTLSSLPTQNLIMEYWPRCNNLLDYETKVHQWVIPMVESLPSTVKINYDGLAGDIPFNGMARASEFFHGERLSWAQEARVNDLADRIVGPDLHLGFLSKPLRSQISREFVIESVRAELERYGSTKNRLNYYYLMNRTRRAVSLFSLRLLTRKIETFFPFLDNDLFEFVMSLPPELKLSNQLRKDMLDSSYPELQNIPTAGDLMRQGCKADWQSHPAYHAQRRKYFLHNLRKLYIGNNWIFDNTFTGPRVLSDLLSYYTKRKHVSYVFNEGFVVFYSWLDRYFPKGV